MSDSDPKLPVGIVNEIIDKISSFTKEIELLRSQLASKKDFENKVESLNDKLSDLMSQVNKTYVTIKTVFVVAMIAISLAFIGAQFMAWYQTKQVERPLTVLPEKVEKHVKTTTEQELNKILKELNDLKKELNK